MAPSQQRNSKLIPFLKKVATILTTVGFLAAAVFLAVGVLLPANAAPANTATDVQPSLLLALDKPQAPLPKLRLSQMPSTVDAEDAMAAIVNQHLTTELNNWTYTASAFTDIINGFDSIIKNFFSLQITLVKNEMYFWTGVLQSVGLNSLAQQYVAALNDLTLALSSLFATAPISPHS
jgi:hypothetical protein